MNRNTVAILVLFPLGIVFILCSLSALAVAFMVLAQ